jgi:uncharacterized membrane protein HdeD (DUF308 family)
MSAHSLARSWWLIVLRGVCAVLFGLAAWVWPNLTLMALIFFLGVYLLTDGLLAIIAGLSRYEGSQVWWLLPIEGAIGIVTGTWALLSPGLTAITLLYLIAAWAIVTGMITIIAAIRLRAEIDREVLLALSGVLSVALGMILVIWPGTMILSAIWLLGTYTVTSGLLLIGLGVRLWNWQSSAHMALHPAWAGSGRHPRRPAEK